MKLLITGGHLTPALALLDYVTKQRDKTLFVGRKFSSEYHGIESREKSEVENRGATFKSISTIKFHRHKKIQSILTLPKIIFSISRSYKIISDFNPDVIVSFGGYVAIPIVIAAKIKNIPIFTHEQTITSGLANKIIGVLSDKIGVSWPETKKHFSQDKVVLTGNPIRQELRKKSKKPVWVSSDKKIIYITGGNQGSQSINKIVAKSLDDLTKKYYVIHQCGGTGKSHYFHDLNKIKLTLPKSKRTNYTIRNWFSSEEVSWILSNSKLIVSRSGANTVTEIIYKGIPAIFIPLPFSGGNEQFLNAKVLSDHKAAVIIDQKKLSKNCLLEKISKIEESYEKFSTNSKTLKKILVNESEKKIYTQIKKLHENKKK
ncbi:glycosyltransferase [Patescibacteria group bacterium]